MMSQQPTFETEIKHQSDASQGSNSTWAQYAERHRITRVTDFPAGVAPPKKVRLYFRCDHYLLQWWEKTVRKTLSERVDGDLLDAIMRAREIDERLKSRRSTGRGVARLKHRDLVDQYLTSLVRQADAREIDPATVKRYSSALKKHYLGYAEQPENERLFRYARDVNRDFQLGFSAFLNNATVKPNGHLNSISRPMCGQDYVTDVARAMYQWAVDPDHGNLLPDNFRNPFLRKGRGSRRILHNQLGQPDITVPMATDFLYACDDYQRRLFAPLIFYGLRPSELCYLFHSSDHKHWLEVYCQPEIDYRTKGGRNKRLPLVAPLPSVIYGNNQRHGLLYLRRRVVDVRDKPKLLGLSKSELVTEFEDRCKQDRAESAVDRRRVRDQVIKDAGGMNYDHIATEFGKLHRRLEWPQEATLKDFRHLCASCLENAGMPEHYRKYLLGHSTGHAPIVTYTHLNKVSEHYQRAANSEFAPLIDLLEW